MNQKIDLSTIGKGSYIIIHDIENIEDRVEFYHKGTSFFLSESLLHYIFGFSLMMSITNSVDMNFRFDTIYGVTNEDRNVRVEKIENLLSKTAIEKEALSKYIIIRNSFQIFKNEYTQNKIHIMINFRYALARSLEDDLRFTKSRKYIGFHLTVKEAVELSQLITSILKVG